MEDRVWIADPAGKPVEYIRSDLWPVDVAHGVHISGITFGLSACVAAIVTAIDPSGYIFAELFPPKYLSGIKDAWLGTYSYDASGVRSYGWHRPNECPRRAYR